MRFSGSRFVRAVAVFGTATVVGLVAAAPPAMAVPSASVVVNEAYGGGGNSGATLTNDFIELHNRADQPISLAGWSVQYHSASGTGTWQVTPLTGSIAANGLYLIAQAAGTGGTQPLPTPDVAGTIAMGGTGGVVALVNTTVALTCTVDNCAAETSIIDLVGYGTALIRETAPVPGASNTLSVQRAASADTDNNAVDFFAAAPTPKAANSGGEPPPVCPAEPGAVRVHDIQGSGWLSPYRGQDVSHVPGVVTAVRSTGTRGFWIQDTEPDSNPATSEGVFVFVGSSGQLTVSPGDAVMVSARVTDFYPLSSGEVFPNTSNLSITELTNATVAVCSTGNPLPAAELITADAIPGSYAPQPPTGNVEDLVPVDPSRSVLDFWESREGMRVSVQDVRVVGPGNQFGEVYVTAKPDEYASERGGTVNTGYANTPTGRITVFPVSGVAPQANVGDILAGATTGPVDYILFGGYSIAATQVGTLTSGGIERQVATAHAEEQLAIASYNVENLSPRDSAAKFDALAAGIVTNLASPDIVVLEEIQDNNGPTDNGVVAADQTLDKLVAAIVAAGGPAYQWRQIDPENKVDGGQPGGNIRVAFLFNPLRVEFVDRPGGDATTPIAVVADGDGTAALTASPGRVDPGNTAWASSRKPLAGEFRFGGEKIIVLANHFNSKGGDQNADGRYQPPARSSEVQRLQQAAIVNDFVDQLLAVDPHAKVVVAGDINDYQFSPVLDVLTGGSEPVLLDLVDHLPPTEQYSYVFNGISQVLDHILVSPALAGADYEIVHINAEFADQISDHDPEVVRLNFAPACTRTISGPHVGTLRATDGVLCLDGANQIGQVIVSAGASLVITDSTVTGSVTASGADTVTVCGSQLIGPVSVRNSSGAVELGVTCGGNRITGPVSLTGNTGGVIVAGNTVVGPLSCSANDPAPTDGDVVNRIIGSVAGQCRNL